MPLHGWTSTVQREFLIEELVLYQEVTERLSVFPNLPDDSPLTDDQATILGDAITVHQKQLRQWMQWHSGAGNNRSANKKTDSLVEDLMKPKTRVKKPWEIYVKIYYKARVKNWVATSSSIVTSPEIQEEINCITDEQEKAAAQRKKGNSNGDEDIETPTDPLVLWVNIEQCGPTLQCILHLLNSGAEESEEEGQAEDKKDEDTADEDKDKDEDGDHGDRDRDGNGDGRTNVATPQSVATPQNVATHSQNVLTPTHNISQGIPMHQGTYSEGLLPFQPGLDPMGMEFEQWGQGLWETSLQYRILATLTHTYTFSTFLQSLAIRLEDSTSPFH
ncbi:hypothetical protein PAXINDRAFT_8653 [Paxillus involutus ATCC 200175]|nr:hypothetical protein PAXINDRAFT_8653 [Paxillus involutus ATCC 200175]